jgi:hypothetical protein
MKLWPAVCVKMSDGPLPTLSLTGKAIGADSLPLPAGRGVAGEDRLTAYRPGG